MEKIFIAVILCIASTMVLASDGMIVLTKELSFLVKPPSGWIADTQSGVSQGVNVVLYPNGSSWRSADAVMYARVKEKRKGQKLSQFVAADERQFQAGCPGIQIQPTSVKTNSQYAVQSRRFFCSAGSAPNSELVSYVDVEKYFVIWVASARTESALTKMRPAFEQVLGDFMVWNVQIK